MLVPFSSSPLFASQAQFYSSMKRNDPHLNRMDPIGSDYATMHAHTSLANRSPKRKRTEPDVLSAADCIFAPELSSSQPTISEDNTITPSLPLDTAASNRQLPQGNVGWSASFPQNPYFNSESDQTSPAAPEIRALENEAQAYPDSPRSAVARKLEGLDLASHHEIPVRPFPILRFGDSAEKKKVRLDVADSDESVSDNEIARGLDPAGARADSPSRSVPRNRSSHISNSPSKPTGITKSKAKRSKSPPLPSRSFHADPALTNIIWWTDAEITGHLGLDPEDDGYGINGVGFRPTPAMAAARSIKRRRQVDQWKIRELREERRRRADGRNVRIRSGSTEPGGQAQGNGSGVQRTATRTVRFA